MRCKHQDIGEHCVRDQKGEVVFEDVEIRNTWNEEEELTRVR